MYRDPEPDKSQFTLVLLNLYNDQSFMGRKQRHFTRAKNGKATTSLWKHRASGYDGEDLTTLSLGKLQPQWKVEGIEEE